MKNTKSPILPVIKKIVLVALLLIPARGIYAGGLATTDFNYINDLIGGRATGLGGAYTAISDDPSGAYYNPAGLVFAFDNQISLSVNSYKNKNIKMDKAVSGEPYKQDIESFYPSFFGVVQSLGPLKIALTFLNYNNEILDQADFFTNITAYDDSGNPYPATYNINYNITDNTLLGGISAAMFITDNLSIGVTGYAMRRSRQQIANQIITFDKTSVTTYQLTNQYLTELVWGFTGTLGIQYMPANSLAIGLSMNKGVIMNHQLVSQIYLKNESAGSNMYELNPDGTYKFTYKKSKTEYTDSELPYVFRGGVAWFPSKRFLLTGDVIYNRGAKYYQNVVEDTLNYAAGMEVFVTSSFPVRVGFFTNFANTPKIDPNQYYQEMHVDLYGASLSLGWQTKNSSINLSGYLQYGKGDAQVVGGSNEVQKTTIMLYSIAVTGSAKY